MVMDLSDYKGEHGGFWVLVMSCTLYKFIELYAFDLCTFLYVCYSSMKKVKEFLTFFPVNSPHPDLELTP